MRVARILTRFNLGGPARQVLAADPRLNARGIEVTLFVGRSEAGEGDLLEQAERAGLRVRLLPDLGRGLRPDRDWRALRELRRELVRLDPDLVHTHASKAGLLGRLAADAVPRARRVHSFHGHVLENYFSRAVSRLMLHCERRLATRTDGLVAVSQATLEDLVRLRVDQRPRIELLPPGLELEPFACLPALPSSGSAPAGPLRAELGIEADAPLVLVVGRLAPVKRPRLALEAFALAEVTRSGRAPAHLAFLGDGSERPALEAARARLPGELAARVHLLGARSEPAPIYAEADLVLLASHSEGLPVALIEAGAAARPALATRVGGVPELITPDWNGKLASSALEEAARRGLAEGLLALLDDPAERRRMGLNGRERALERHGADALVDGLERLYRRLLAEGQMPLRTGSETVLAPPLPPRPPDVPSAPRSPDP
jgi:glycosyltransferase involved in cell wall biosynthesis